MNCETENLIYAITCLKCLQQYIGETCRTLKKRFSEHQGYVRNKKLNEPTGYHFNLPGHNISMMQITVLEKVWNGSTAIRKTREKMYIRKFQSLQHGINRTDWSSQTFFNNLSPN